MRHFFTPVIFLLVYYWYCPFRKERLMSKDYHLHTIVSDGTIIPDEIFQAARKLSLHEISITDHDAVGAYFHFHKDLFARAGDYGVTLVSGIELDSRFNGVEVHILGYGIDLSHEELTTYLAHIQQMRQNRIRELIAGINAHFGDDVIKTEDVFAPYRDTVMSPHLVHTLLDQGLFRDYRTAAKWISRNVKTSVQVPKPDSAEMIRLINAAGGMAVLAHPGFYIKEHGLDLDHMLKALIPVGLEGMEVEYRYRGTSPEFPTMKEEHDIVSFIREKADENHLVQTRGSDAHKIKEMEDFHK